MDASPALVYVLVLLISAISILLVSIFLLYLKSQKELNVKNDEAENLKKQVAELQNSRTQIDHTQAQKIINEAYQKASQIIQSVQVIPEQQKQVLMSRLQMLVDDHSREYQKMLSDLGSATDKISQGITNNINEKLNQDIQKISTNIEIQLRASSQSAQQGIANIYRQFENDYITHKRLIMQKIDAIVADIFKNIAKEQFGIALTKKQQEDLIFKALEEAKRNSFFSGGPQSVKNGSGKPTIK